MQGGGGAAVSNCSIVRNRLGWFMECSRGPPTPPSPLTPPEERKIIFRIVNFKHEKAVFNLAEAGLKLYFVNVCVLWRKTDHVYPYTQRLAHTCTHAHTQAYLHTRSCSYTVEQIACAHTLGPASPFLSGTLKESAAYHLITSLHLSPRAASTVHGDQAWGKPISFQMACFPTAALDLAPGASLCTWAGAVGKHCLWGQWDVGP